VKRPRSSRCPSGCSSLTQSKRPCQYGQSRDQVFILGEDLHRHVVGAGVEVLFQSCRDLLWGAVRHHRVDQAIAARPSDVVFGEAQPLQLLR